jgi:transposase-like protein
MKKTRTRYSQAYKDEALALADRVGSSAAACELGLQPSQLCQWRAKAQQQQSASADHPTTGGNDEVTPDTPRSQPHSGLDNPARWQVVAALVLAMAFDQPARYVGMSLVRKRWG